MGGVDGVSCSGLPGKVSELCWHAYSVCVGFAAYGVTSINNAPGLPLACVPPFPNNMNITVVLRGFNLRTVLQEGL